MKKIILLMVVTLCPINVSGKIVKHINPDGSITYTNTNEESPVKQENEESGFGDIIDGIKIYSISTKQIKKSSNYIYVGVKIKVKNLTRDKNVKVKVICVDENGFQLDYTYVDGIITPGRVGYITDQIMLEKEIYSKVSKWKAK